MRVGPLVSWLAFLLGIGCCLWRSFNLGYQAHSYALSCLAYLVYILEAMGTKTGRLVALRNLFYFGTSLVAVWRWSGS